MRILNCMMACGLVPVLCAQRATADGPHYTVRFLNDHQYPQALRTLAFSPDGSTVAVSIAYGDLKFIRTRDGETFAKFPFDPFSIAYSVDGSRMLMIGESKRILFDVKQLAGVDISVEQQAGFVGIEFEQRNGKWLVSKVLPGGAAEQSGNIHVGDEIVAIGQGRGDSSGLRDARGLRTDRLLELIKGPAGTYVRLQVIHRGELVPTTYPLQRLARKNVGGTTAFVAPEQPELTDNVAWCIYNGLHQFTHASSGQVISEFRTENVNNLGLRAISADSKRFAVLGDTEAGVGVEVFDIASRERLVFTKLPVWETPDIRGIACYDMAFLPDGTKLVVGTWDTAEVLDLATKAFERKIALDGGARGIKAPRARGFAAGVVTATADSLGISEDTETRGSRVVEKLAVSARGILATGSPSGQVKLWDLASGRFVKSMPIGKDEEKKIERIAFSADGKWLAYYVNGVLHLVDVGDVQPDKGQE